MSTDFEQRLRAEMEHIAVRPRPGLVKDAHRRYRGKRRRIRAVAAAATAVAIAAGTVAGVAAATASPTAIPALTTAYVLSHASSALAATNRIMYTTTTTTTSARRQPRGSSPTSGSKAAGLGRSMNRPAASRSGTPGCRLATVSRP